MSDRDPAFLWETEALRSSTAVRKPPVDVPATPPAPSHQWRTLRDTYLATGIPVDTLRKWARRGAVPSFLDLRDGDPRRMVRVDAVVARAHELGRRIRPVPAATPERAEAAVSTGEAAAAASRAASVDTPPDTMIVPIAAWDKMLMQLGNLHEAGQQLAEARERAARAETEAAFLRERLAEVRAAVGSSPPFASAEPASEPAAAPQPSRPPAPSWRVLSSRVFAAWRERYRRRQ